MHVAAARHLVRLRAPYQATFCDRFTPKRLSACVCRKVNGTPCISTTSCLDIVTSFGCQDYSLSHQQLYFMIGKMVKMGEAAAPNRGRLWS